MQITTEFESNQIVDIIHPTDLSLRHFEAANDYEEPKAEIVALVLDSHMTGTIPTSFGIREYTKEVSVTHAYPFSMSAFILEGMREALRQGIPEFDLVEATKEARHSFMRRRVRYNDLIAASLAVDVNSQAG